MTDTSGNSVYVGMLCYIDVDNLRIFGVLDWDSEYGDYCICSTVADIKCPVSKCDGFYVWPWYAMENIKDADVEGFVGYYKKKINMNNLVAT